MKRYLPLLLTLMLPAPLAAQQDSVLRDAVRLATEGRGDSARAIVRRKLATTSTADSSYAEVLYTAGVVASNSDSALRYLRRTTIEFSQSPWADRALLRIAQMAFAAGDPATTFSSAERVITDYPFSPVRAQAAYWAGRAQIDLGNLALACRYLRQATDSSADDIEIANRARFYVQRCQNLAPAKPDSARPDSTAKTPAGTVMYAVQVAAVKSPAAADQSMQALRRAGYDARVSRDADGLLKVRVGHFKTKAEAQRQATEIRRKVPNSTPFVVDEP